jgi:signal transduction histidine kinase
LTLPRSFRTRLLVGAIVVAAGVLPIAHLLSMMAIRHLRVQVVGWHAALLLAVALAFIAVGLSQVRRGLSPFDELRSKLSGVREGNDRRLEGVYPTEVQPLVNDLNALLGHREAVVRRAMAKAGDLAHGLKTPLAVLAQEAERAREAGQAELAAAISQQVERMRSQMDYHLAQARSAASGATPGARCSVIASAEGLARTLLRLHAGRGLRIDVRVPPEHAVRVEREDLDEILGNLLDNACKWARSRVAVESLAGKASVVIYVDDDGPGLDPSLRQAVLQRGVRADEASAGSGFGLAIVRDLVELYGGSLSLDTSPLSGLRARLELPAAGDGPGNP